MTIVGFCGGGGTPLLMANEIEWLTLQSEYRPTKYIQGWLSWWWDDTKRLEAAKQLQLARLDFMQSIWSKDKDLKQHGFNSDTDTVNQLIDLHRCQIPLQTTVTHLLQLEARLTKQLYKLAAVQTGIAGFSRQRDAQDKANIFLNHGNYLAYGLGATTTWVLGLPHGFAVMHGKTRRGALVFDIADLVKDALVLPLAFICAKENAKEQAFRQQCLQAFTKHRALDYLFEVVENLALKTNWQSCKENSS